MKGLVAGGAAGIELFPVGHALDAIKTRQQTSACTIFQASTSLYQKGGVREFYKGLRWNLALAPAKNACRWLLLDSLNKFYSGVLPKSLFDKVPVLQSLFVSATLAAGESIPICFLEKLKTWEMTNKGLSTPLQMLKIEGLSKLMDGWNVVYFKQLISWTSYLVAYQQINKWAVRHNGEQSLSIGGEMLVGASAGAINVFVTSPLDTIKTQIQKADAVNSKSLVEVIRLHQRTYGFKGFFNGLPVRLVRNVWWAMIVLPIMNRMGIIKGA